MYSGIPLNVFKVKVLGCVADFRLKFHHIIHAVPSFQTWPGYLCLHEERFRLYWLLQRSDRWETEKGSHASLSGYIQLSQPTLFLRTEIETWWAKYCTVLTGRAFWKTGSWVRYCCRRTTSRFITTHERRYTLSQDCNVVAGRDRWGNL